MKKKKKEKNETSTSKLLSASKDFKIGSLNTQTLNNVYTIPELISLAERTGREIICIQEQIFVHEDIVIKKQAYDK